MHKLAPKVSRHEVTENELAWIGFLRTLSQGEDPAPSLAAMQSLRVVFDGRRPSDSWVRC
ncbi:hypothetical protein C1J03_14890 [Sulfitobacter sp. SK012]|nr:hypothetical protein C1J03_14890 [Sulfitobacter sp. SK012]